VIALTFDSFGDPGVLGIREVPTPLPGRGEARIRMHAIGLNFADVYRRKGNYTLVGEPPWILGYEGAGVVDAVGEDVRWRVGDRVAFADVPRANAEQVVAPASHLVALPESVSFETAAAAMLQGLTAQYLVRDSHRVVAGETMLVHAAAGGVGLLLVQLGVLHGATVIGVTSSAAKAAAARQAGASEVLLYDDDWAARARGVDVVYDSVGSTLDASLAAARTGGHVVFYGMAGGDPAPVAPRRLMDESKTLTGGDLWNVLTSAEERARRSAELFEWIGSGKLRITIAARFPLADGAQAHAYLEGRGAIGKVLIIP
jgi:NADPH2:quinone reductase